MKQLNDYVFYSDFYFEEHFVGNIARLFTNIINSNGILLNDSDLISSKKGYNVHIISMSESTFKLTWDLKLLFKRETRGDGLQYYDISIKQIKNICEYFCVDKWEEEFNYYSFIDDHKYFSSEYNSIQHYTKNWVNYISFQNSRIILQFDLEKFKKTDLRKYKLQQLI